jgi:two-component system LytT family sensor kinase
MDKAEILSYGLKKSNPLRYTYGFILGFSFTLILDIFYSLKYQYFLSFHPFSEYLLIVVLTYIIFESLFVLNRQLDKKYNWNEHPQQRFFNQLIANALLAIGMVFTAKALYRLVINDQSYIVARDEITLMMYIFIIILGFVATELAYFLLHKWRFNLAELERFKKENAEYRFELLQSQLNPHFLFNSLNTLSALVYENQDNAGLFIRKLSDVYRYILDHRDTDLVDLDTELSFADSYIMLMKLRFAENLRVNVNINDEKSFDYRLAPLSLQMLLENAFKHNVVSQKKPLKIDVSLEKDYLIVENNKQPKLSQEKSHQMGLKNLNNRYEFLTEKKVIVEDGIETFTVKLPLIQTKKN